MKLKKITLALAALLSFSTLAACAGNNKVVFYDYWKSHSESNEKINEKLEYEVTFTKDVGLNNLNYTLTYGTGKYVTTLQSTEDTKDEAYVYTTRLEMPVQYEYNGEKSEEFIDVVTTEVRFYSAKKVLTPISSKKTVISHTPVGGNVNSLADAFAEYNFSIETNYADGEGSSKIVYQKTSDIDAEEKGPIQFSLPSDYSYLDNEQLLLALRAIQSSTTSGKVACHNPFLQKTQTINFSFQAAEDGVFTHTVNGTPLENTTLSFRKASLTLNEINPGATQTVKIAAVSDAANNVNRSVMLSLETPLPYAMGTLIYTLKAATYA